MKYAGIRKLRPNFYDFAWFTAKLLNCNLLSQEMAIEIKPRAIIEFIYNKKGHPVNQTIDANWYLVLQ